MAGESQQSVEVPKPWWPAIMEIPKTPWLETEDRRHLIGQGIEVGLTVGSAYNFAKGSLIANSSRFQSGFNYSRANCLRTSGTVAAALIISESVDNALLYYRQKDDPLNSFVSGAVLSAGLTARCGPITSSCSGLAFGTFVALLHHYGPTLQAKLNSFLNTD